MGCDSVFVGEDQHGPFVDWVQDRVILETGAMGFVFPHVSQVLLHGSKERTLSASLEAFNGPD